MVVVKKGSRNFVSVKIPLLIAMVGLGGLAWWRSLHIWTYTKKTHYDTTTGSIVEGKSKQGSSSNKSVEGNPRKFVSYHSSPLEELWLANVDTWADNKSICSQLTEHQRDQMHQFMIMTCTSHMLPPYDNWCIIDDEFNPIWYNKDISSGFDMRYMRPTEVPEGVSIPPPKPVLPDETHEHLVSKFIFLDERTGETYVEYIEPLVSHLRSPLSICVNYTDSFISPFLQRGYVIPPPNLHRHKHKYYFDAGSSSWAEGAGGPSLKYFVNIWKRHDIDFTEIYAYEMSTPPDKFYEDIPKEYVDRTHYQEVAVSARQSDHSHTSPFIPFVIQQKTTPDDYVLFKLDIDALVVEIGSILAILADDNTHIDEVVWEHHVSGNYLMQDSWGATVGTEIVSLRESYEYFLNMRKKGIRAHSWI